MFYLFISFNAQAVARPEMYKRALFDLNLYQIGFYNLLK